MISSLSHHAWGFLFTYLSLWNPLHKEKFCSYTCIVYLFDFYLMKNVIFRLSSKDILPFLYHLPESKDRITVSKCVRCLEPVPLGVWSKQTVSINLLETGGSSFVYIKPQHSTLLAAEVEMTLLVFYTLCLQTASHSRNLRTRNFLGKWINTVYCTGRRS